MAVESRTARYVLGGLAFAVSLVFGPFSPSARAERELRVAKRPVSVWVRELGGRDARKAEEAARTLRYASGLAGVPEIAVPALVRALDHESGAVVEQAIWGLGRYGPTAAEASDRLRELAGAEPYALEACIALVLISDDVEGELRRLGVVLGRIVDRIGTGSVTIDTYRRALFDAMTTGLRGHSIAETFARLRHNVSDLVWPSWATTGFNELHEAGTPLLDAWTHDLGAADPWTAYRAAMWIARLRGVPESTMRKLLALLETLPVRKYGHEELTEALALGPHIPFDDVLAWLRKAATFQQKRARLWAHVGLALRAPDPAKVLRECVKRLGDRDPEVRRAAVHGLMVLGPDAAPAREKLEKRLEDPFRSVRWRAAVALNRMGRKDDRIRDEVVRALDGPSDHERVELLGALGLSGVDLPGVRSHVERWARIRSPILRDAARRAGAALDGAASAQGQDPV